MPNERMTDTLNELLRATPGERARSGFTQAVLARLDAPAAPSVSRWTTFFNRPWMLATATATALLLSLGAAWLYQALPSRTRHQTEARQALAEIRAEHARLQQEFQNLSTASTSPDEGVVYIGGNENVDFVVDLERVAPAPRGVATASYANATY